MLNGHKRCFFFELSPPPNELLYVDILYSAFYFILEKKIVAVVNLVMISP